VTVADRYLQLGPPVGSGSASASMRVEIFNG